jgi:hypothetical protein
MTAYIKLSTLEYPRHIGDIEIDTDKNYAHVEWVDMPVFNEVTHRCDEGNPIQIEGAWSMTWIVRETTQEEIDSANKPFNERFPI